jgi:transcription termination factor Rho
MSVLDREALEQSPLADLHAIASELSIDSYRLLRREPLIDAILARQEGADGAGAADGEGADGAGAADEAAAETAEAPPPSRPRRRRRTRSTSAETAETPPSTRAESAESTGPAEKPASDRTRFEAAAAKFPDSPLRLGATDPALAAIEALAPFGLGSRVSIVGPSRAGKTETLRRIARALKDREDLRVLPLLLGVRPEEIGEWSEVSIPSVQALSFAAPASAQDRAVYAVIDEVRPHALRGGDALILLDTLDGLREHAARRVLATARNLVEGGSVTVIATAPEPFGGETTVIALDPLPAADGEFPALDAALSGTLRAELLVGEEGAAEITRNRAERLKGGR